MTSLNPAAGVPGRALRTLFALLLSGLLLLGASAAGAQEAADAGASDAEIDALVRSLEDPDQRAKLIEQLKLLKSVQAEAPTPLVADGLGAVLLSALSAQVEEVSRGFAAVGTVILAAPDALLDLVQEAGEPETRQRWLEIAVKLAVVLGAALVAKWLAERLLARPRRLVESRGSDSLWVKIPMLGLRGIIEFLPIVAFYVVANAVLPLTDPRPATSLVALTIINANVIARAVRALAALVLCPAAPALRLTRMSDESANYAYIWVSRLTAVSVYGYFFAEAALLLGLPSSAYALLLRAIGLFVCGMVIVVILQNRAMVADWLRGRAVEAGSAAVEPPGEPKTSGIGNLRQRLADVWHVLAMVYVVATYGIWALDVPGGFEFLLRGTVLTAVVLGLLRLLLGLVQRGVARGFALSGELKARYPRLEGRANRYLPVFERLIRAVLYLLAALWLLEIWGVDSFGWMASDFGRRVTGSLVTIAVIVVVTALLLEITDAIIERYLASKDSSGRVVVRSARARTLLPLIRNAFRVVLGVMVTLIVLSELGINIAPLLAGAGVVGLAIGFGAQTLVKDVITGFFILAEDTLSVGDVADIDGNAGVVEAMTIRSIRLRDVAGTVYTIPFSAVTTVKNLTKDFSYAKFDVGVAYDSDVDEVIGLMREVAAELRHDPEFRYAILDDLEVMGLNQFADSALMLLARLKTPPGQQWRVSREFNRRLKMLFDKHGVEIPFPQRTIHMVTAPTKPAKTRRKDAGEPEEDRDEDDDKDDDGSEGGGGMA
jgi:small conductance mechanosensitive channel